MAWSTPKTDWVSTDRFNIEDYNRIKNNLEYLHETAAGLNGSFSIADMGDDIADYTGYFLASRFNQFESNLETINQNMFTKDYGDSQTFYDNGVFIQYDELNRIESATLSMYQILERQAAGLTRLSFTLGAFKAIKI